MIAVAEQGSDMLEAVVQRLRGEKKQEDAESGEAGNEAGRLWAAEYAANHVLRAMERCRNRLGEGWCNFDGEDYLSTAGELLFYAMYPRADKDSEAAEEFLEATLEKAVIDSDHPAFIRGFAEGALAVWDQVKHRL